jgi:hypothetical protein
MEPLPLVGVACVIYLVAEIALAAGRCRGTSRFGAVDVSSGRPIDVVVDRRNGPVRPPAARRLPPSR